MTMCPECGEVFDESEDWPCPSCGWPRKRKVKITRIEKTEIEVDG